MVGLATLEDLVSVAVDYDRRVIEDERDGRYYVLDDDSLYVYVPEELEDVEGESEDEDKVLEPEVQEAKEPTVVGDELVGEKDGLEDESDESDS